MGQSASEDEEGRQSRGLLERERELAALSTFLVSVPEKGDGDILVLEGEAGIGKSSLLGVAVELAEESGFSVLRARGDELERDFPWGVTIQLFAAPVDDEPDRLLRGPARLVRPLFEMAGNQSVGAGGFPIFHGLYWLTVNLAEAGPLLLAIDDVHLADAESLELFNYLKGRLSGLPVAIVVAKRSGEPSGPPEAELLSRITAGARHLEPGPLSGEGVRRLVLTELPEADEETVRSIEESVSGNPFLCLELAASTRLGRPVGSGSLRVEGTSEVSAVRNSIMDRLVGLGPGPRSLAQAVAVLGPTTVEIAAAVGELDREGSLEAANLLIRRRIMVSHRALDFVHPVVREAVLGSVTPPRLEELHRRAATALRERGQAPERIATHLRECEPFDDGWAIDLVRDVAAADVARGAPGRAAESLSRALAAAREPGQRGSVLIELGKAEAAAGRPGGLDRFRQALATLKLEAQPAIALELGEALYAGGNFTDAVAAFDRGLDLLEDSEEPDPVLEARLIAGLDTAGLLSGVRPGRAAVAVDRICGRQPAGTGLADRILMAVAAGEHSMGLERPARQASALALSALDGSLAEDLGRAVLEPLTATLIFCGEYGPALEILDHHISISAETGQAVAFASLLAIRSNCHLCLGNLGEASSDADDVIRIAREIPGSSAMAVPIARGVMARVCVERDDPEGAREAIRLDAGKQPWFYSPLAGWFLEGLGSVELAWGDPARAEETFLKGGEALMATGGPASFSAWRSGAAMALLRQGRSSEASELAGKELGLVESLGSPRAVSVALRTLAATAGNGEKSIGLLQRAIAETERGDARLERARGRVELGAALRRDGLSRESREHLRAGMEEAREIGASALVRQASDELEASGAKRPAMRLKGEDSLTPSQRRVAVLAASGLSNRQIAAELFVTLRTVETHLTMAYRKLSITSRADLAEAMGRSQAPPQP